MSKEIKIVTFPDQQTVESEAAQWLVQIDKGALAPDQEEEFSAWLNKSAHHRDAIEQLSSVWQVVGQLESLKSDDKTAFTKPTLLERFGFEIEHRVFGSVAAVAAVIAVIVMVGIGPLTVPDNEPLQVYRTIVGGQKTVSLSDGSVLQLNTDSHIEVQLTKTARIVRLNRGEVYFTVNSDKKRPFSVYADDRIITAVGTAFSVFRRALDVEVTVAEGDVKVSVLPEGQFEFAQKPERPDHSSAASLTAGEWAVFSEADESIEIIPEPELNRKLAWRQGLMAFAGEPLSDVVSEVSRYTDLNIIIKDPALKDVRFGGYFKVGNVDALFDALEQSFGVLVERENHSTIYLSTAPS